MIGTDLSPTGVTPITAVPTRIRNGSDPALLVWTGDGRLTELLDRWVTDQIAPRIAEARRLADESNQRKASHLGERVLHALEMAGRRTASASGPSNDGRFGQSETRLREAAGLIERTNNQCFHITGDIREAAADAIRFVADAAMNAWLSEDSEIDLDSNWFRKHLNAIAQAKAQELAGLIQRTAATLSDALNKAGEEISPGGRNERFWLESLVKELSAADFPGIDAVPRRPRSLSLSTSLARRSLRNQLESKYGARVAEFFNSLGRALELWFRNTLMTLDKEFNSNAEVYRAQLQRLAGAGTQELFNQETIAVDIACLRQQLGTLQDVHELESPTAV